MEVEEVMMDTLRTVTKASNDAYVGAERPQWCQQHAGQVVLCTDCIFWTAEVTECLKKHTIAEYEQKLFDQVSGLGYLRSANSWLILIPPHLFQLINRY